MSSHKGIKCEPAFQMITQLHIAGIERGWDIMLSNESYLQVRMLSVNPYTTLYSDMMM